MSPASFFGRWLHRLNDTVTAMLTRQPVAPAPAPAQEIDSEIIAHAEAFMQEYHADFMALAEIEASECEQLCAAPTPRSIAPPSDLHPAVLLAASGMSQRAIAAKLGCTRYQVRKALA